MARGRKPNHEKKPSRQLANQRAFRKRRADLLATLEEKTEELERENAMLKADLSRQGSSRISSSQGEITPIQVMTPPQPCRKCVESNDERAQTTHLAEKVLSVYSSLMHSTEILKRALHEHGSSANLHEHHSAILDSSNDPEQDVKDATSLRQSSFMATNNITQMQSATSTAEGSSAPLSYNLSNRRHIGCCLGLPNCHQEHCPFLIPGFT